MKLGMVARNAPGGRRPPRFRPPEGPVPEAARVLEGRVLFEDDQVMVLDKPAGLPVHAGPKGGENLDALLPWLAHGKGRPPGLAHRLDRETSGCLVLGRTKPALARLGELFAKGAVAKTYWAIVRTSPHLDDGRIELALAKRSEKRGWWMAPDPKGQEAITDIRVLFRGAEWALIEARPRTGRTHQIRVHLQALAAPLLGDAVYGERAACRLMLHARAIEVPFVAGRPIVATAPVPEDFRRELVRLGLEAPEGSGLG